MSGTHWPTVLSRMTAREPVHLDDELEGHDPRFAKTAGTLSFPEDAAASDIPTPFDSAETVAFAARITEKTKNRVQLAATLAQMAYEKGAEVIILSHVDVSGLERFGFRVERVAGETEADRAACEAQLIRFWNIVFVI